MASFNWTFTAKGHDDLVYDESQVKWLRYSRETGSTGYEHLQGFFGLKKQSRLTAAKKIFADQTVHLAIMRGRIDQNVAYCTKETNGKFDHAYGNMPASHKKAGSTRWDHARELVDAGNLKQIRLDCYELWMRYGHKFYEDYNRQNPAKLHDDDLQTRNIWIYGPSGTGKTSLVYKTFPASDIYVKNRNKWWDNYRGESCIFIDEVSSSWKGLEAIKIWADRYPFNPEVKNGHLGNIRPRHIVVCTQYTIEDCCHNDTELEDALKRRFTVVHIDELLCKYFNPFKRTVTEALCPVPTNKRKLF